MKPFKGFKLFVCLCIPAILFIGSSPKISASVTTSRSISASPTCGSWSVVPSPNPSPDDGLNILPGVTAVSTNNVWAVGDYTNGPFPDPDLTLIEHWNGSSWTIVASPNIGSRSNSLSAVAAVSANDIWAVGSYEKYKDANKSINKTLIEHWDGKAWSVVHSPNANGNGTLFGVTALSANDIWAVGSYGINKRKSQTLIEHWDGTLWQVISSPSDMSYNMYLTGVTAISSHNIWAVGSSYNYNTETGKTLIQHWDGTKWSVVTSPNPGSVDNQLSAITVVSNKNIWAVGTYSTFNNYLALIEHWDGTSWQVVPGANFGTNNNYLFGVAAISANNIWAVGNYTNSNNVDQTLIEQWNGAQWSVVSSPSPGSDVNVLYSMAVDPADNIWAVGYYRNIGGANQTLTEFYC